MTYSDWRAELSEGVKTRLLMKSLKGAGKLATKLGKKVRSSIDDIGTTKAKQGRNIFIKNRDGTKIQNPNVKSLEPEDSGQMRLLNTRNKNLKVTNPLPKQDPSTVPAKGSSGPNRSEIKKKNTAAMKTAQSLINQQNSLKRQGRDGLQVKLLKKSDYPKRIQRYLGDDFDNFSKIQESAIAIKIGSKYLIPALMTGIGAAGTIMQARRKAKKAKETSSKESEEDMLKRVRKAQERIQSQVDTKQKMKKANQPFIEPKKGEIIQDEFSAPTNNVGGGKIAGTVEAGDDPPVKKKKKKKGKKKTYAYGGRGSRKMWMA